MKIQKEKIKKIKDTEIVDIVCDICQNSCFVSGKNKEGSFEYLTVSGSFGYWSNKDCENWTAHICEKCVDEHLSKIILFNIDLYMNKSDLMLKKLNDPINRRRKIRKLNGLDFEIKMSEKNEE